MSEAWPTAITEIQPNRVAVRGYDIAELMGISQMHVSRLLRASFEALREAADEAEGAPADE